MIRGSRTKLPSKKPKQPEAQRQPQSLPEWLEHAAELEEKGERYQDGEKARRAFEAACKAYAQAAASATPPSPPPAAAAAAAAAAKQSPALSTGKVTAPPSPTPSSAHAHTHGPHASNHQSHTLSPPSPKAPASSSVAGGRRSNSPRASSNERASPADHASNHYADCLYNWGRLLLLLGDFKEPPYPHSQRHRLLAEAATQLRRASGLDETNADALFNLAQALRSRFELVIEDADGGDPRRFVENGVDITDWLTEADPAPETPEPGDETPHIHDGLCGHSFDEDDDDNEDDDDDDEDDDYDDDQYEYVTEKEPVTLSSLVDTLVAHASLLSLAASNAKGTSIEPDVYFERAMRRLDVAEDILRSEKASSLSVAAILRGNGQITLWTSKMPVPEEADANIRDEFLSAWCDIGVARAQIFSAIAEDASIQVEESSPTTDSSMDTKLVPTTSLFFGKAAAMLDRVLARNPACAEAASDKGDVYCNWADAVLTACVGTDGIPGFDALNALPVPTGTGVSSSSSSSASSSAGAAGSAAANGIHPTVQQLRTLYASAAKAYTLAQKLAAERREQQPSVSRRLGDLEATRTQLYRADAKTRNILLANAATHYKRALDACGVVVGPARGPSTAGARSRPDDQADSDVAEEARAALVGLAKVTSWIPGREEDCKLALMAWRRKDGEDVVGDGEGAAIEFSEAVVGKEWFSKLVGGA
ncbi:hypothetical protein DFJ73DRAFT_817629 [Zopfochytrium polystomum]|nr:hypothetical protein DFJ73DRAFT_817629 [Zopfochytrium polystomum]